MKPGVRPLTWQILPLARPDDFAPHAGDWDTLNTSLFAGHSMLHSDFVQALLVHFWRDDIHLCIGREGDSPRAMCLVVRRGLSGVWASYLPSQTQVGTTLMTAESDLRGLLLALPGYAAQLDLLCNDPQLADLRQQSQLAGQSMPHALTMNVSLREGFEEYWAQRPRKLIQNMRRYLRRLQTESAEPGQVQLRCVEDPAELDAALARYATLESQGWKGREGTAVTVDNAQGRFYRDVLQTFGGRQQAMVYELWQGQDLLASRLVLRHGATMVMLKTAFSEPHERFAPGRLLLMHTLEDLFNRFPGGVVEFYTNADADMLAWSTGQRWINHVSLYRNALLPLVFGLARASVPSWLRGGRPSRPAGTDTADRQRPSVEVFAHPQELPADALALLAAGERRYMEFGAGWFGLLVDHVFGSAGGVRLFVLRRMGRAIAVLPTVHPSASREVTGLSNYYTSLFTPLLDDGVSAEDLLPLVEAVRQAHHGVPAYRFAPMDPESREFGVLREALRLGGLVPSAYFAFGNWYMQVAQDWTTYLQARSGELRSTLKRKGKRFAADGGRLEIVTGGAELERGIAAYQAVYAKSWKVPEPYPGFVPGLIRLCAERGWLRLGLAWLGDQPVAAQLWIVANGRAHIYKLAYDEAHKALAAGTLLTARLMEEAFDRDAVTEIDYLIGDDPYKKTWMNQRRERQGLISYDPRTLHGLLGLVRQALGRWRRKLRPPAPDGDTQAPLKTRAADTVNT